ncbi:L-lysine exporter family protein LysE/ArgO [Cryobacterium psychrotolerans]|uniref:L-lysine exporter family protein LysE/ArgO n=1 Tax=Cryobacterium psychrotolerans TaxID=386301 RepID=A0A1G9FV17_9MICO|nr:MULTISPECIES: LysE/ArgO family amino acid transporter [Cryobacterium]TFD44078.1 amino acid transporter [Cryobacterium sp. TMT1-2-1]TFD90589.1 amino acid transporter [Cryobacterium psychrotolerans]SDK92207.1 L-lysine exporter family protein LysE/ArgO [Cryobacterium psychrotolerans]
MQIVIAPLLMGLGTGLALIVAIGAQNAFVLRLGIAGRGREILAVVAICAASDIALIAAGVLGIGSVVERFPVALIVLRFVGAAFLIGYGVLAARRAVHPGALRVDDGAVPPAPGAAEAQGGSTLTVERPIRLRAAVVTALAFTWLNPHVYLDTLIFAGSIANQQGPDLRWWWAAGAMIASLVWFFALGFGARLLRPIFARPGAWRVLDICIAVGMIGLGLGLAIAG